MDTLDWKKLRLYELVQKLRSLDQITQGELKKLDSMFPRVMAEGETAKAFTIEEIERVIYMGTRYLAPTVRSVAETFQSDGRK